MGGSLTIGYCFPIVFWKFLWGEQRHDGGRQSHDGGSPSTPTRKTLARVGVPLATHL